MHPTDYLKETERAVWQLFDGLAYYRRLLDEMHVPVFITDIPFDDKDEWTKAFEHWHEENREVIEKSRRKSQEYLGLSFSNATLCGSVLQIASMGISSISKNIVIPDSCKSFVDEGQEGVRYCIGREVRGLPIGIIIYAARNQYNHWEDPKPRRITQAVFDGLALGHGYGPIRDPAFDLSNPSLTIYTHNILALLEWHSYHDYYSDMQALICI
jgi:hypothetical protein